MSAQTQFLTQTNYNRIVDFLRQHFASRLGVGGITERVDSRIQKTVQHYMTEVAKLHSGTKPPTVLSQEVLRESTTSIDSWLQKQMSQQQPQQLQQRPLQPLQTQQPVQQPVQKSAQFMGKKTSYDEQRIPENLFSRNEDSQTPPGILAPDFRYPMNPDDDEDPMVLYKRAAKQREEEARAAQQQAQPRMEIQEVKESPTQSQTSILQPVIAPRTTLQQDYIIPQETVVKYRETEHNIFITSADRDWLRNKMDNRYSFSVLFNPGNRTGGGYGLSPSVQERLRNIQRIEFVKVLLPTESLTTLVRTTSIEPSIVTNTDRIVNVFSLPFVGVRIAELNNNGFSTNPREDNTFAIVQYDAQWSSDQTFTSGNPSKNRVGYTGFIPKFLKCQKVYEPTPLSNLQKLTIRMERHDGNLLSELPDVFQIVRVCLSSTTTGIAATNNSVYAQSENSYIFIQTSLYFPYNSIGEGDLINVQGYDISSSSGSGNPTNITRIDFRDYVNAPGGQHVIAVGHVDGAGVIQDGPNAVGYCNIVILRSRFDDPSTGSTSRSYYGGNMGEETELELRINTQESTASVAGMINMSRQTHMVLRVVTRDMDAGSNIRPDNL
jgi:hypothetical protein